MLSFLAIAVLTLVQTVTPPHAAPVRARTLLLTHRRSKLAEALDVEVALALPSASAVEWGLWQCAEPPVFTHGEPPPELSRLAAARALLQELAAAPTLAELVRGLSAHNVRTSSEGRFGALGRGGLQTKPTAACGWTLRVERLSAPADGAPHAAVLCAVSRCIDGPPALDAASWGGSDEAAGAPGGALDQPGRGGVRNGPCHGRPADQLLVLQGATAGYVLARVVWVQPAALAADGPAAGAWRRRPFKFEASTDYWLARIALSACGATAAAHAGCEEAGAQREGEARKDEAPRTVHVLDPCAGSGTIAFAAAAVGLTALGCDANGQFVERAGANVRRALGELGAESGWIAPDSAARGERPVGGSALGSAHMLGPRDASEGVRAPLPARPLAVATNLPWGRGVHVASSARRRDDRGSAGGGHEAALAGLLRGIGEVTSPGTRHALISGAPIGALLGACGFDVLAAVPVGSRGPDGRQTAPLCHLTVATWIGRPQPEGLGPPAARDTGKFAAGPRVTDEPRGSSA